MLQCERLNMKPAYLKATTPSNIISGWMNDHYRAAFLALVTRYKIIINNTINFFLKTAASILLILNHYSLRATLLLLTLPLTDSPCAAAAKPCAVQRHCRRRTFPLLSAIVCCQCVAIARRYCVARPAKLRSAD